jgi:hypothetical protein
MSILRPGFVPELRGIEMDRETKASLSAFFGNQNTEMDVIQDHGKGSLERYCYSGK